MIQVARPFFAQTQYLRHSEAAQPRVTSGNITDQFVRLTFGHRTAREDNENPYEEYAQYSGALKTQESEIIRPGHSEKPIPEDDKIIAETFIHFIRPKRNPSSDTGALKHPCIGAQSAFTRGSYQIGVYPSLDTPEGQLGLLHDLNEFCRAREGMKSFRNGKPQQAFTTFVAIFKEPDLKGVTEEETTQLYWNAMSRLCALDRKHYPWSDEQIAHLKTDDFRPCLGGVRWAPIWLSPQASRHARHFPYPAIAFNIQEQFDSLRATPGSEGDKNKFETLAKTIRSEDGRYNGAHGGAPVPNPNTGQILNVNNGEIEDYPVYATLDGSPWGDKLEVRQGPPDFKFLDPDEEWQKLGLSTQK